MTHAVRIKTCTWIHIHLGSSQINVVFNLSIFDEVRANISDALIYYDFMRILCLLPGSPPRCTLAQYQNCLPQAYRKYMIQQATHTVSSFGVEKLQLRISTCLFNSDNIDWPTGNFLYILSIHHCHVYEFTQHVWWNDNDLSYVMWDVSLESVK